MTKPLSILILYFFIYMTGYHLKANGQGNPDSLNFSIQGTHKYEGETVWLRWAPSSPLAWYYANKDGYFIERFTIYNNKKMIEKPKADFRIGPVKPQPENIWEMNITNDPYFAIAAQALFGESFEITNGSTDIMQIANKNLELENRYSFALFSADQSFSIANLMGLAYIDSTIAPNTKVVYQITCTPQDSSVIFDTAYIFIDANEHTQLPFPIGLDANFTDKSVMLSWYSDVYNNSYSSFVIERSDQIDNNFHTLNTVPFVQTYENQSVENKFAYYIDSLPENDVNYYYRIRGKTPFGDLGPPSDTIFGKGHKKLDILPIIKQVSELGDQLVINWEFDEKQNSFIDGFDIYWAEKLNGNYVEINKKKIKPTQRTFAFNKNERLVNYFIVTAVTPYEKYPSTPYMLQLQDSIPPVIPSGITGIVDSTGLVSISWNPNDENDLYGYRVFYSNNPKEELSLASKEIIQTNEFKFTVNLKSLSKSIYIAVCALDNRYNQSDCSPLVKLIKPDIVPPSPPYILNISEDTCLIINAIQSNSIDVSGYNLYKIDSDTNILSGINHKLFEDNKISFRYSSLDSDKLLKFALTAIDSSNNESSLSNIVQFKCKHCIQSGIIKGSLNGKADRLNNQIILKWDLSDNFNQRIFIYREVENNGLTFYKTLEKGSKQFIDKNIQINTTYRYLLIPDGYIQLDSDPQENFTLKY